MGLSIRRRQRLSNTIGHSKGLLFSFQISLIIFTKISIYFKVFTGSPASSELQRGDIILAIQNRDASLLLHKEADDLIRSSGGSINLTIRRFVI